MWAKLKKFLWQWRIVGLAIPSVTGLLILLRFAGFLQLWEWAVFDLYMRLSPMESPDNRVVIVGIDEADVQNMANANISDEVYAKLLKKLKAQQPRAIGLDIYREFPVEPGYAQLKEVFESTPYLVGIQKVAGEPGRDTVAPPPVLKALGQVGANDLIFDADNKVRRGFIDLNTPDGEKVYSLSLYLALLYLDAVGISVEKIEDDRFSLGKAVFAPLEANDGGYVRTDARGYQILLNYRGPNGHLPTVSMTEVLEDKLPPDWGRDRVILIGKVGVSFNDVFFTPYSGGLLGLSEPMSGVEVHANLTSQIISAALDGRPLIQTWSEPWEWLWILFWSGVGATLTWQFRYLGKQKSNTLKKRASLMLAGSALLCCTYGAFVQGWWIPIVPPLLALAGSAIAVTAYLARSAGDIRKTFGRYLTDEIVAKLLEHPEGLSLGGERRKITILVSDLRGFTSLSERLPPEEVVKILNFYLGYMADVITSYRGTIDEFMGDGILVFFGAPTVREDDAERAVACAVAMQLAMEPVNAKMKELGLPQLEMGIGINTGEVVVGNIGSEKRTKYGVVGKQMNLTYRIESYTIGGQILISEYTLQELKQPVKINGEKEVLPKGVKQPISIYDIGGIRGNYNLFLTQAEEEFLTLAEAIPVQYLVLEGKHIGDAVFRGNLIKLSAKGAVISLENASQQEVPSGLSNIKLNLFNQDLSGQVSEDIYAKVLEQPAASGSFCIHFTAVPPEEKAKLEGLYQSLIRC
ncbi:MAG: adenylate/guanylate cyclase domain-containing protein [Symploca sp. SIO2E6]|nr:adenylate/guanylate cyclase domain-containing protein [Symploca sp. SIO2E6]